MPILGNRIIDNFLTFWMYPEARSKAYEMVFFQQLDKNQLNSLADST